MSWNRHNAPSWWKTSLLKLLQTILCRVCEFWTNYAVRGRKSDTLIQLCKRPFYYVGRHWILNEGPLQQYILKRAMCDSREFSLGCRKYIESLYVCLCARLMCIFAASLCALRCTIPAPHKHTSGVLIIKATLFESSSSSTSFILIKRDQDKLFKQLSLPVLSIFQLVPVL